MAKLYTITLNGVTEDTYTIDAEFPDDIDPAKAPELADAVIREVHQTL